MAWNTKNKLVTVLRLNTFQIRQINPTFLRQRLLLAKNIIKEPFLLWPINEYWWWTVKYSLNTNTHTLFQTTQIKFTRKAFQYSFLKQKSNIFEKKIHIRKMKSTWSGIHKKSTNVIGKWRLFVYESLPFIDSAFGTKLGIPRGLILLPFLTLLNGFFGTFSSLNLSSIFSRSWTSSSKYHLFVSLISNLEMRDSQFLSSWWSRSWFFGTSSGSKHDRLLRIHFLKTFCENFELGRRLVRDDFNFSDFFHLLSNFIWVIAYDSMPMNCLLRNLPGYLYLFRMFAFGTNKNRNFLSNLGTFLPFRPFLCTMLYLLLNQNIHFEVPSSWWPYDKDYNDSCFLGSAEYIFMWFILYGPLVTYIWFVT